VGRPTAHLQPRGGGAGGGGGAPSGQRAEGEGGSNG